MHHSSCVHGRYEQVQVGDRSVAVELAKKDYYERAERCVVVMDTPARRGALRRRN
jgi:hypothetical protein